MTGTNIAMVCDFFYPQLGGVEFHIYHLSQSLIRLGHSVVVITHAYGDRTGVRYLTNGLKVYYIPYAVVYRQTTFPTVFASFPVIRSILIREQIQIVHAHVSVSTLAHESILHANTLGIYTIFTDHSLYGFDTIGSILVNKLLKFTLTCIDHVICVSHTCKENMVIRADIGPDDVSVIPNAVVSEDFRPLAPGKRQDLEEITIVVISRLYPNKGAGLLQHLIPRVCGQHQNVSFLIAGEGPNFVHIQQMIETHKLQSRVQLLGAVNHENVRDIMCLGNIYLHASLTEAFGTVLVEAASCGLLIVTTKVGGIPEVLPEDMTVFAADTSVTCLSEAIGSAINLLKTNQVDTSNFHERVSEMYDWMDVARRTEKIYNKVTGVPSNKEWLLMLKKFYYRDNMWARLLYTLCCITEYILCCILEWYMPERSIERAPKWPIAARKS